MEGRRFERAVGLTEVLALPLVLLLGVLSLAAYGGGPSDLFNGSLVSHGAHAASLLRWSMSVDMAGYYLIVLPLLVLLWQRLRPVNSDLAALASLAGFGYVLVGAIGATLLAVIDPRLMDQYVTGSPAQRQTIAVVFDAVTRGVAVGLWNVHEQVLLAGWLVGMGALVYRERRGLGLVGLAGGFFALTDALGRMVDVAPVYTVGALGTALLPVWLVWWGIELLRRPQEWPAQELETTPMLRAG